MFYVIFKYLSKGEQKGFSSVLNVLYTILIVLLYHQLVYILTPRFRICDRNVEVLSLIQLAELQIRIDPNTAWVSNKNLVN